MSPDERRLAVGINRTKGTTFDVWRTLRWGTNDLAKPVISGETADPDDDGIPNLAEYAFGMEPAHPDSNPLRIAHRFVLESGRANRELWAMAAPSAMSPCRNQSLTTP